MSDGVKSVKEVNDKEDVNGSSTILKEERKVSKREKHEMDDSSRNHKN